MFSNCFKISLRCLLKDRSTSFINIAGLTVGMTVTLMIALWIYDELTFNQTHKNYRQIGIAMVSETRDGKIGTTRITGVPMGNELMRSFQDDFKYVVPSTQLTEYILSDGDKIFSSSGNYMGADAPEMFSLNMIYGQRQGLKDPHSILLSESLSRRFFGQTDPTHKILTLNRRANVVVTGVYKDIPNNSELFKMEFIAPWDLYVIENKWVQDAVGSWRDNFLKTFVQLHQPNDFERVSQKIKDIKRIHAEAAVAERKPIVFIQPMDRWRLFSKFENGVQVRSDQFKLLLLYGSIGLFVLILACINFVNLSTARSEKRAKEVGIRKTLGSPRIQLMVQFFIESVLLCFFSFVLCLGLVLLLLPWFNQVADKDIGLPGLNPYFWMMGLGFILVTAFLAGSYPAFYLSSFNPIKVLKPLIAVGKFSSWPRKSLVIFQFSISIALMICTGIIYKQIMHSKDRPLGYEQNGLVELKFASSNSGNKSQILKNELLQAGLIQSMAVSGGDLTEVWSNNGGFEWKDKDPRQIAYFGTLAVSAEFGKTVGWQIIEGRDFSPDLPSDSMSLILNESAVSLMGLKNPVGEFIQRTSYDNKMVHQYQVIGVTKDLLMASPYEPPKPSVFFIPGYKNRTILKLNPSLGVQQALTQIESIHKKVLPDAPFVYRFVDDAFGEKFKQEVRMGTLAAFFSILAVIISCLGLFGVASYLAEKRTREMGIRKVLGASFMVIFQLLSREFILQITVAILIATTLAYTLMDKWLEGYNYRTEMTWWMFVCPALVALAITLLTVGIQSIKAALVNPIKALRME